MSSLLVESLMVIWRDEESACKESDLVRLIFWQLFVDWGRLRKKQAISTAMWERDTLAANHIDVVGSAQTRDGQRPNSGNGHLNSGE